MDWLQFIAILFFFAFGMAGYPCCCCGAPCTYCCKDSDCYQVEFEDVADNVPESTFGLGCSGNCEEWNATFIIHRGVNPFVGCGNSGDDCNWGALSSDTGGLGCGPATDPWLVPLPCDDNTGARETRAIQLMVDGAGELKLQILKGTTGIEVEWTYDLTEAGSVDIGKLACKPTTLTLGAPSYEEDPDYQVCDFSGSTAHVTPIACN